MAFVRRGDPGIQAKRVGTSDIWILPAPAGHGRIRIPMPPSTNARMRPMYARSARFGGRVGLRLGLTDEAKGYLNNALALRVGWKMVMGRPLEDYTEFRFTFFMENMAYDTHNGLKLACDMIEKSGLILNDKFILPQVAMPLHAPGDPRAIIEFPLAGGTLLSVPRASAA